MHEWPLGLAEQGQESHRLVPLCGGSMARWEDVGSLPLWMDQAEFKMPVMLTLSSTVPSVPAEEEVLGDTMAGR